MKTERKRNNRTGVKRPFWKKGAIIHHLKVVHCVRHRPPYGCAERSRLPPRSVLLPTAEVSTGHPHPCREQMISATAPIIQGKLHFPCVGFANYPLCCQSIRRKLPVAVSVGGLVAEKRLQVIIPQQQIYILSLTVLKVSVFLLH